MTKTFDLFVLLTLLSTGNALAETEAEKCTDDIYAIVGRDMKIKSFAPRERDGNIVSESCRSWPYKSNMTLLAFAYDEGVAYEKTMMVAMINKKTKHVVSSYRNVIGEDALTEFGGSSLQLDTTRYQLAKGVTAFGLRFNSSAIGASCGEANWGNELTLLVPDGKHLRPVLNLHLYHQKSIQGCLNTQVPDAVWQDAETTISILKTHTHGFYDLLAKATITTHSNGAPIANMKARAEELRVFRYNGKYYEKGEVVPWWLDVM